MSNRTQQLLDLAAAHQGDVSDYRLGKLSGFAQSSLSAWRTGVRHLGPDAVIKFCELAGIKDVLRWQVDIGCERQPGPDGNVWRALRDELTLSTKVGKPVKGGMIDALVRSIAGKAAGILLAGFVAVGGVDDARASQNTALARTALPEPASQQCILCNIVGGWVRGIRNWLLDLLAPPPLLAPAA